MQLSLNLIQPYIDTNQAALSPVVIEGVTHFTGTVIDVNENGIHMQLGADVSARLKFDGEFTGKAGSTVLFNTSGEVIEITSPEVPKRAQESHSRRSPDKALEVGLCAPRRDM